MRVRHAVTDAWSRYAAVGFNSLLVHRRVATFLP